MLRPSAHGLPPLPPTADYRPAAFVEAARRLDIELTVPSERPSTFQDANPAGLVTLDLSDPDRAVTQARAFAREHPLHGVAGVDDDTAVVAAAVAGAPDLRGDDVSPARAPRGKHQPRAPLAPPGVAPPPLPPHGGGEGAAPLTAP